MFNNLGAMGRRAQCSESGMGRATGTGTGRRVVGLPWSSEAHCRTDHEASVKLQQCLAQNISQLQCCRQQAVQQTLLVSPFSQLFGYQKVRNGNSNKVLVLITVLGSAGPLRVILDSNATSKEVIKQALELYSMEGRRPVLTLNSSYFELHFLQEPSEVLESNVRIGDLIFRQFLLFQKKAMFTSTCDGDDKQKIQSLDLAGKSWWNNIRALITSRIFMQTIAKSQQTR